MNFYLKILPGLFFILIACEKNVKFSNDSIYNISPTKVLDIYKKQYIALIDVRTEREYRYGHIPNSKLIPLEKLHQAMSEIEEMKEKKLSFTSERFVDLFCIQSFFAIKVLMP